MTRTQFLQRRAWGQIYPEEPVRTIIFRFAGGHEWEEIFVAQHGQGLGWGSIAEQEADFRAKLSPLCTFISQYRPQDTIPAKNWR